MTSFRSTARDFVAMVTHRQGTQAVTVRARDEVEATAKLLAMGYLTVLWVVCAIEMIHAGESA